MFAVFSQGHLKDTESLYHSLDMWKATHVEGNPLQVTKRLKSDGSMSTKSDTQIVICASLTLPTLGLI